MTAITPINLKWHRLDSNGRETTKEFQSMLMICSETSGIKKEIIPRIHYWREELVVYLF